MRPVHIFYISAHLTSNTLAGNTTKRDASSLVDFTALFLLTQSVAVDATLLLIMLTLVSLH
jgi:hypothetical protein